MHARNHNSQQLIGAACTVGRVYQHGSYCSKFNPMRAFGGIRVPTLVLNALDDPVCLPENIPVDLIQTTPHFLQVGVSFLTFIIYSTY